MNEKILSHFVKVPITEGETVRRELIAEGLINKSCRPRAEGGYLLIPVIDNGDDTSLLYFEKSREPEDLSRHEQIGGLVILQEDNIDEAKKILAGRPSAHTALFATSPVEGEFRTRTFKVLAGKDTTETVYREYGKKMIVDLSEAYFSARLSNERQRLLSLVKDGEMILDMFAGVGPFSVMLSEKAKIIFSNDINPNAVYLMQKNIRINHLKNVVPMMGDAEHLPITLRNFKFDRIIMNLPFDACRFLNAAEKLCGSKTVIHLYSLAERKGQHNEEILRTFPDAEINEKYIRSYSPNSWHAVYDIEVNK